MRFICPECGSEIPEDLDFCQSCGRKRDNTIRLDQSGHFVPPEENRCASCGGEIPQNELLCPKCGEPRSRTQLVAFRPHMVKNGWIGLAIAMVAGIIGFLPVGAIGPLPGLFNIYGLGHLYFRKWTRGALFLLVTGLLFVIGLETDMSFWTHVLFVIASMFFYVLQTMEVLVLAFMPPKTTE